MTSVQPCRGFTLIELMIVIGILGLLAAVLLPNIVGTTDAAAESRTEAIFLRCEQAAKAFERAHGYYPPSDLRHPERGKQPGWKPDNGHNTGIESFVAFCSLSRKGGTDLSGLGDSLCNTDGDQSGVELPLLGRSDRPEICDAWGTPLGYFSGQAMGRSQSVIGTDGVPQKVEARRDDRGRYLGARKFQLVSAGKDRTFGTDDDLVWPKGP